MLWNYFLETYEIELYNLWKKWISVDPKLVVDTKVNIKDKIVKTYYVKNPYYKLWYDKDEEDYVENEEEEFFELVDEGDRVLSFEKFVCAAYENSIP